MLNPKKILNELFFRIANDLVGERNEDEIRNEWPVHNFRRRFEDFSRVMKQMDPDISDSALSNKKGNLKKTLFSDSPMSLKLFLDGLKLLCVRKFTIVIIVEDIRGKKTSHKMDVGLIDKRVDGNNIVDIEE